MKVLLAVSPLWGAQFQTQMSAKFDVIKVQDLDGALAVLDRINVAVVGFHFDQRRPDRLLRVLQHRYIPTICVRGISQGMSDEVFQQIKDTYLNTLGCKTFVDLVGDHNGGVLEVFDFIEAHIGKPHK